MKTRIYLSADQEKEIVKLYLAGMSQRELGRKFDTGQGSIKKKLVKHDVQLRTLSEANMIYSLDDHIFDQIDTHEKAYWLGFLSADGNVCKGTVKIGLAAKDIHHLYRFKHFLNYDGNVHVYDATLKGKKYPACQIEFRSSNIIEKLATHNIVPNKSNIIEFSQNISEEFISSYILGIFDGDGCWNVISSLDPNKIIKQLRLSILGSKEIMRTMQHHLVKNCDLNYTKLNNDKRCENISSFQYGGNTQIVRIANYLYTNAPVFLPRKKKIILDHLGNQIINTKPYPYVDEKYGLYNYNYYDGCDPKELNSTIANVFIQQPPAT